MPDLLAVSLSALMFTPSVFSAYQVLRPYAIHSLCSSPYTPYVFSPLTSSLWCGIKDQRDRDCAASCSSEEGSR